MRANSLALRLFLSATVWTVLILVATGFVLSSLSRQAVERAFDRRLGVYLKTLIADVASPETPNEKAGQTIGEPLFDLPLSGWYWQVTGFDPKKPEMYASRSLWDGVLPRLQDMGVEPGSDGIRKSYVPGQEDQRLRLIERVIDLGEEGRFLVAVAGDASEIDEEIVAFDRTSGDDVCRAGARAADHHAVPGAVRPRAAQAHLGKPCRDPLRRGGEARRLVPGRDRAAGPRDQRAARFQSRDRRARAHPRRQSRARAQDAAVGDVQRGECAPRRSARRQGDASRPTSCASR